MPPSSGWVAFVAEAADALPEAFLPYHEKLLGYEQEKIHPLISAP